MTSSTFREWYRNNREAISQRRKQLYQTDANYRQKCLDRAAARREALSATKTEGAYTLSEAATLLGVTQWTLSSWRSKGYFPQGEITDHRLSLLERIRDHFKKYPRKQARLHTIELDIIVNTVNKEW